MYIADKDLVEFFGKKLGYGRLMQLASMCWREHLEREGLPLGGEFVFGPCRSMVVECVCTNPKDCDFCCGTGWLTEGVRDFLWDYGDY